MERVNISEGARAETGGAPTLVIGHKNPDTDSICSAIAYAALKNRTEPGTRFVPCRAGGISGETQFILEYFGVEAPAYVDNVFTQIKDIDIRRTKGVTGDVTLKKAWGVMKDQNIVSLPIVDGDRLIGIVTLKDILRMYMDVNDARILAESRTSYKNVLEALDGELLTDNGRERFEDGKILVAAANPDVLGAYIEEGDIIITSNRYESQLCAIEMNAGCVITTTGAPVAERILNFAREHGCAVISTPHDTYSAAKIINQSVPVSYIMKDSGLVTFNVEDSLENTKNVMLKYRHRDFPVLDEGGRYYGMISRRFLLNARRKQLILVDHNERSQGVDGIEEAEILEIIDHHRIGGMQTMSPVFFRNQPVGCTSTIISQIYREKGIAPEKEVAGLMCAAIISDTLQFRSPTATEADRAEAEWLAGLAGLDLGEFSKRMFRAGNALGDKTGEELFHQDYKEFSLHDVDFGVGQISSIFEDELAEAREKVAPYLRQASESRDADMVYFMLTNIADNSTEVIYAGEGAEELLLEAFAKLGEGCVRKPDSVALAGVVSRKLQMAPALLEALQG
ncbi:MAG: putative manganese-dependent inorganic diphosphatase [Clostridiales Family XIII bacterium]|jgi:manganese-dependent inorganic pyrophosphatase|nr:putative manganese-dependent inorganic diphosphatase [Clostridiales Family XIII bacterium]